MLWAPPHAPDQTSKEDIKNGIQGLLDRFSFEVDPRPEEVEVLGDCAYAIGSVDGVLTPRAGGDPVSIKFRIFLVAPTRGRGVEDLSLDLEQ